jgi:hypothetical protein
VQTSQPGGQQVTPPQPELTKLATVPAGQVGGQPTATPTTPTKEEPTPEVKPTEPVKQEPAPTPEPTKIPEPPQPVPGSTDPVINVTPDTSGGNNVINSFPPASGSQQPESSPATGGGPSTTHVWLALLSAIMVLGGWSLRRMANVAPQPASATVTAETE